MLGDGFKGKYVRGLDLKIENKWNENEDVYLQLFSKKNLREEGSSSSVWRVIESSLPAHLRILERFSIERPRVIGLSHLYSLKPFSFNLRETKATWAESIACMERPLVLASILTDLTKSLIASTIFLKTTPYCNLASNILASDLYDWVLVWIICFFRDRS